MNGGPVKVSGDAGKRSARLAPAVSSALWNAAVLCAALAAWQLLTLVVNSRFLPGPVAIARAFVDLAVNGDTGGRTLWEHSVASVERVLVGFGIAVMLGVPLGLLMGLYGRVYANTRVVLEPFRFIPPIVRHDAVRFPNLSWCLLPRVHGGPDRRAPG